MNEVLDMIDSMALNEAFSPIVPDGGDDQCTRCGMHVPKNSMFCVKCSEAPFRLSIAGAPRLSSGECHQSPRSLVKPTRSADTDVQGIPWRERSSLFSIRSGSSEHEVLSLVDSMSLRRMSVGCDEKKCRRCGVQLHSDAKLCPKCSETHSRLTVPGSRSKQKEQNSHTAVYTSIAVPMPDDQSSLLGPRCSVRSIQTTSSKDDVDALLESMSLGLGLFSGAAAGSAEALPAHGEGRPFEHPDVPPSKARAGGSCQSILNVQLPARSTASSVQTGGTEDLRAENQLLYRRIHELETRLRDVEADNEVLTSRCQDGEKLTSQCQAVSVAASIVSVSRLASGSSGSTTSEIEALRHALQRNKELQTQLKELAPYTRALEGLLVDSQIDQEELIDLREHVCELEGQLQDLREHACGLEGELQKAAIVQDELVASQETVKSLGSPRGPPSRPPQRQSWWQSWWQEEESQSSGSAPLPLQDPRGGPDPWLGAGQPHM